VSLSHSAFGGVYRRTAEAGARALDHGRLVGIRASSAVGVPAAQSGCAPTEVAPVFPAEHGRHRRAVPRVTSAELRRDPFREGTEQAGVIVRARERNSGEPLDAHRPEALRLVDGREELDLVAAMRAAQIRHVLNGTQYRYPQ